MNTRQEILDLLAKGKITADEAAEMLNAVQSETADYPPAVEKQTDPAAEPTTSGKQPSWFRVRVRNLETGQNKVSVNIPLPMLKFGLKLGRYFSPELDGMDFNELTGLMAEMGTGMLVDVQDEEDNEHVQVFVD